MRYLFLLLAVCLLPFSIRGQVVKTEIAIKSLAGLQFEETDYIIYNNTAGTAFSIYLKSDVCDLLEIERQKSGLNLSGNVYVKYKGKLLNLGMDETHNIMFPRSIFYIKGQPDVMILELDMVNFIATRGYTYIILEFKDNGTLNYAEFSERETFKNISPVFKKYKKSEYKTVSAH